MPASSLTTAAIDARAGLRDLAARMLRFRVGMRSRLVAVGLPLAVAAATYLVLVAYSMFLLAPVELPTARAFGQFVGFPITNAVVLAILLFVTRRDSHARLRFAHLLRSAPFRTSIHARSFRRSRE